MAFGDFEQDEALFSRWEQFCDRLKEAGKFVFKDANPATGVHRADGFRYLAQNLGQAFEFALETKNTKYPNFVKFCSPMRKLASDMADCVYYSAWVDGQSVYRISGKKGTARMSSIGVQGPRDLSAYGHPTDRILHEPFGDPPETSIFGHEIEANWDGSFELFIGGDRQGQNWLPSTPGTRRLFLRQYFDSWDEQPAEYRIERVGMKTPRPMPSPDDVAEAMLWASDFVYDVVEFWPEWTWSSHFYADPEKLNIMNSPPNVGEDETDKRVGRFAAQMWWELKPGEAMVLEFDDPHTFWNITAEGVFGNSMDYLYRNVSYTPSRTATDPDGKLRFVLAAEDPGFYNWIDNQGFEAGMLSFRIVGSGKLPEFKTTVIGKSDVADLMHEGSPRASETDRERQLMQRFRAIQNRYKI